MSEYDLVLHVGMPRSGDVLEPALARLRPQLRLQGVAFVGGPQIAHQRRAGEPNNGRRARRLGGSALIRELTAVAGEERREAAGVRLGRHVLTVVSSRRLFGAGLAGSQDQGQLRPYAARTASRVISALSARRVQVVLYTQRQDRLMELAHLRRIRARRQVGFEHEFPHRFEPVLDYLDLIERLRAVPGVADVVVRPVELVDAGQHAFVNDFLDRFGLGDALDLYAMGIDPWPYPPVYSARGAQLALAIDPLMDTPEERRRVQAFLWKNYRASEGHPVDLLDRDVRQRILDGYADRNRELFRTHMPDLPADSYSDDSSTFALGNVLRQPVPPRPPTVTVQLRTAASTSAANALAGLERRSRPIAGRARRAISGRVQRSR